MPAVSNKTQKPLSVPLPGGKTLHLSPGKTAQISASAVNGAGFKKLVEAGEIALVEEGPRLTGGTESTQRSRTSTLGRGSGSGRRSGDR